MTAPRGLRIQGNAGRGAVHGGVRRVRVHVVQVVRPVGRQRLRHEVVLDVRDGLLVLGERRAGCSTDVLSRDVDDATVARFMNR